MKILFGMCCPNSTMKLFSNAAVVGADCDPSAYHAFQTREGAKRGDIDFVMSRSELMTFAECPHKWIQGYADPMSGAKEWGSLIDVAVLDPTRFNADFVICPETYPDAKTGEMKPWTFKANYCKEWREKSKAFKVITMEEASDVGAAVKTLYAQPIARELLMESQRQVFVLVNYTDPVTQLTITIKILIDLVPNKSSKRFGKALFDLKSMKSAHPAKVTRDVFAYHYDAQAALYRDVYVEATGEDRIEFGHLIQENVAPWEVLVPIPILSEEFLELGRAKYLNALRLYCHCLVNQNWPSYPTVQLKWDCFQIVQPLPWMSLAADSYRYELDTPEPEEPKSDQLADIAN